MMNLNVAPIMNKALLTQCWGRLCWYTQEKGSRGRKESGEEWPPAANNKASEHFCVCESLSPVFPSVWRNGGLDWTHRVMLTFVKKKKNHILLFLLGFFFFITSQNLIPDSGAPYNRSFPLWSKALPVFWNQTLSQLFSTHTQHSSRVKTMQL